MCARKVSGQASMRSIRICGATTRQPHIRMSSIERINDAHDDVALVALRHALALAYICKSLTSQLHTTHVHTIVCALRGMCASVIFVLSSSPPPESNNRTTFPLDFPWFSLDFPWFSVDAADLALFPSQASEMIQKQFASLVLTLP